ncbi:metallophosphoesterase [Flammeovirga sp. SJP92]|uniref:metallophosphoesterase n=1 Tax=Flammeovirga sp. SJP92 TaxID=1775430 RepID=UPI0007870987|nr:metallophosphoesterase [Flammeovirga sp. SJP92]KXX71518.1 phosphoesterase [Flammeovirga sp. SJP92]
MLDLIGDIHGHADKLESLLQKLGYKKVSGVYGHPDRKVLFVGDYIDRGPKIRETLQIVKSMTEMGHAIALMGNHEYNAICFHMQNKEGGHIRKHWIKNIIQHYETLKQFQNRQKEYNEYIEWFLTLPLFYEDKNLRAVHACWDEKNITLLKSKLKQNRLTKSLIEQANTTDETLNDAIEQTLKGKELRLPDGLSFSDKDGNIRKDIRYKWWEDPLQMTFQSISVLALDNLPTVQIKASDVKDLSYYREVERPVFFGHYWLKIQPMFYKTNVCCLDYSVAKGGLLVAYRFDDERELDEEKFVTV